MARRRTIDRLGQRAEFDEEGEKREDEEEAEEEEEGEDEEEAEAELDDEAVEEEEEAPKPKKPKKKPAAPKRTRAAKIVRKRAIWVIFDNSSKQIETFPFNQKAEAEKFLAEKNTDKKGYYIQMVKVDLEEK